jgi:hypothetical protein
MTITKTECIGGPYSASQLAGDVPIFETDVYAVHICDLGESVRQFEDQKGYQVYNKVTDVIEGETNAEFAAIHTAIDLTRQRASTIESAQSGSVPTDAEDVLASALEDAFLQKLSKGTVN